MENGRYFHREPIIQNCGVDIKNLAKMIKPSGDLQKLRDLYGIVCYIFTMIKNIEILRKFESDCISGQGRLSYDQSMKLFDSMWKEGVSLGVLPPADPLAGIEVDIRVARILNSCLTKPSSA
jgi:hypothetical protein